MQQAEGRIEIDAPVERVFHLFSDLESFPRWMSNVVSVRQVGDDYSQWIATAPLGGRINWIAETTAREPNRLVAWRSAGGDVETQAEATFAATARGGTLLRLSLSYGPQAAAAEVETEPPTPLGVNPELQLAHDLQAFKRIVEGEAPHASGGRVDRTTGELDPEFLGRLAAPVGDEEEETIESDFGRTLQALNVRPEESAPFYEEPAPPPAPSAPAEKPPAPAAAVGPSPPPVPTPPRPSVTPPRASSPFVAPAAPPPRVFASTLALTKSAGRRRRFSSAVYLILALAALLGALAGFLLAARRRAATAAAERVERMADEAADTGGAPAVTSAAPDASTPAPPAATPSPARSESVAPARGGRADDEQSLKTALADWIATTNGRDMKRLIAFYQPTVESFYQRRNVPRATIRAEKVRVIERADLINMRARDPVITFSSDGQRATMRFRKSYVIESRRESRRGEVLQELIWEKTPEGWKIAGEKDIRVIR